MSFQKIQFEFNKTLILTAFLLAFVFSSCQEALLGPEVNPSPPAKYDSYLATMLDSMRYSLDFPALAGAIITDTGILDAQAVGCRRYAGKTNITTNDKFHLGSCTKAFTAVLIGVLVDEGKLNWTSTLPSIFPEYSVSMREEYRDVTIKDILSHSAGFIRDPNLILHSSAIKEQRLEVVVWALSQPPVNPRGRFEYSNLGYIIAGAITEKLTNQSYEELLIKHVIEPLGITSAGFGPMGTPGKEDQPLQHTTSHSPIEPTLSADNHPVYSPAGRLHMSIGDWAKYIQWMLSVEAGHPQSLLKRETAKILTTSVVPDNNGGDYALGWSITNTNFAGGKVISHSGSNSFNYATAWLAPNKKFGIITAVNQGPGDSGNPLNPVVVRLINYQLDGY